MTFAILESKFVENYYIRVWFLRTVFLYVTANALIRDDASDRCGLFW
jgi:hypothetical protein